MSRFSVEIMTTPPLTSPRRTAPPDPDRLPWLALLTLGAATLVMVTGEMLPMALLTTMSAGLDVSEARTGLLVSLWALVVVVASLPLVRLTRAWDRTAVITGAMLVFAVSAAATALAPTYAVALASRVLGAAAVGLLWSTVNAHVAELVPDRHLARATAVVLGGGTLGLVLGTPVGRFVADLAGWRASFWVLAVLGLAVAWLIPRVTSAPAAPRGRDAAAPGGAGSGRIGPTVTVAVLVALVLVGHFGAYTYITVLAEPSAALVTGGMGTILLIFGLSSAVGVAIAGRGGRRTAGALVLASATTAAALLSLVVAQDHAVGGLFVVAAWGLTSGTVAPLAQTLILRLAGSRHRSLAGALIPVLFNAGIAAGSALASGVVSGLGVEALPAPAAATAAVAALGLLAVSTRARPQQPCKAATA